MEACQAALGRDSAGDEVPDGEREEITGNPRAFLRKAHGVKAKLAVGWV